MGVVLRSILGVRETPPLIQGSDLHTKACIYVIFHVHVRVQKKRDCGKGRMEKGREAGREEGCRVYPHTYLSGCTNSCHS